MIDKQWNLLIAVCLLLLAAISHGVSGAVLKEIHKDTRTHLNIQQIDDRIPADSLARLRRSIENNEIDEDQSVKDVTLLDDCAKCDVAIYSLQAMIKFHASDSLILDIIDLTCKEIEMAEVCNGLARHFGPEFVYVLRRANMWPKQICSFMYGEVCGFTYSEQHDWDIALLPTKKPPVSQPVAPKADTKTFKVLHLSDTHFDPLYQAGTSANCGKPLCCRADSGKPSNAADVAGKWGAYTCDTPKRTVDHMLNHIKETHPDIHYILWTGDLPPHDIWDQTREGNLKIIRDAVKQMSATFPGIPIFPALGNHESAPVNDFAPPFAPQEYNISWLYKEIETQWKQWLPAGVYKTVGEGAFYSVLVQPGFRIVSVNTNYCNNKNWWLMINSTDPLQELHWLMTELQKAEDNHEKVHIIGHIPPGSSECLKSWSRNYYKIVERYESTITAQFFGHTHFDEFEVFYDSSNLTRAINIAYVGPSVTPYYNLNPGYRIYYVDGDDDGTTRMVVDHETWIMNLTEANLNDAPVWRKSYRAREAYQMASLLPKDWDSFIHRMMKNSSSFDQYYRNYYKHSPVQPSCDRECRENLICNAKSGRSYDRDVLCRGVISNFGNKQPRIMHKFMSNFIWW